MTISRMNFYLSNFVKKNNKEINKNSCFGFIFTCLLVLLSGCGGGSNTSKNEPTPQTDTSPSVNVPPTVSAGEDQSADEQTQITLNASASDSDGSIVSYQWSELDGNSLSITSPNTQSTTVIIPTILETDGDQTYLIQLTVTDNDGLVAIDTITVTASAINNIPTLTLADQTVESGSRVTLTSNGGDYDGSIDNWNWQQTAGLPVTLNNANAVTADFMAPLVDTGSSAVNLLFSLTVTDNEGAEISKNLTITVNPGVDVSLPVVARTHFDIPPDDFGGSIDFIDAIMLANSTGETHTITLERYHGSEGAVSVSYQSYGDSHTNIAGSVSWAAGEIGRKSFEITIPAQQQQGEHKVYIDLSNPTGNARLGRDDFSRMYIITDNDSEAPNAIWVDSSNGNNQNNGSKNSPVKTISDAILKADEASVNTVYLKSGIFDMSNEVIIDSLGRQGYGVQLTKRSGESDRLTIRSAPGQSAILDGIDNTNYDRYGFFANERSANTGDYITLSNLTIRNVVGGLVHRYTDAKNVIILNTDISNLDGPRGNNVSGVALWGVLSGIIFNNKIDKSRVDGERNGNGACIQTYWGRNLFIQQNTLSDCSDGIYHKRSPQDTQGNQFTSAIIRRNLVKDVNGVVHFGIQGGQSPGHSYSLVSQNIFKQSNSGTSFKITADTSMALPAGHHNEFSHNLLDRRLVTSDYAYLSVKNHLNSIMYGNIVLDRDSSRYLHRFEFYAYALPADDDLFDYMDFNIFVTDQGRGLIFTKGGYNDTFDHETAKTWGIEINSPILANDDLVRLPASDEEFFSGDFHITPGSSWETFAPGSLPTGPYIDGNEQIGADF